MTEISNTPKRAYGRSLSDLWLEDGQGISDPHDPPRYGEDCRLHPAEWGLLECAVRGEPYWVDSELEHDRPPKHITPDNHLRAELICLITAAEDLATQRQLLKGPPTSSRWDVLSLYLLLLLRTF